MSFISANAKFHFYQPFKNYMLVRYIFFSFFILTLISCEKNESKGCDSIPSPVVSVNSVVDAGGTIYLTVDNVIGAKYYEWTGPNGFTSTEKNPSINQVQSDRTGKYQVRIGFTGGCVKTATSDSVVVTVPSAPCSPNTNTARIAGVSSINFYSITGKVDGGSYFITANGDYGDVELEFAGKTKPVTGVYTIRPLGSQWLAGDVRLNAVSQSSNWPCGSGKVYVTVNNNSKVTAAFCNLPVTSQTFGFSSTLSGTVTEE
jgi:hypothetical protein